jgi:hypothetical protein
MEPAMFKRRITELALLKRMEVKLNPLMAGACTTLGPGMFR